jgi:hypothetical protein
MSQVTSSSPFTGQTVMKPFSLANFKMLLEKSVARKFLGTMDMAQIQEAIDERNFPLLKSLYEILKEEQKFDEKLVADFIITKNRLMDEFYEEAEQIKKEMIDEPMKAQKAQMAAKEEEAAENILSNL